MSRSKYFEELSRTGPEGATRSDDRVQVQTLGTAIEVSGHIAGRRCLDVGCGQGQLARMLLGLGARDVVAVDHDADHIARLAAQYPEVSWRAGDIGSESFRGQLGSFDLIYLLEVLQYLPVPAILEALWTTLAPGGRILATFPSEECPSPPQSLADGGGRYVAPPTQRLLAWARSAPALAALGLRGFNLEADDLEAEPRLASYALSSWSRDGHWPGKVPHRLQLVMQKQALDAR